MIRIFPAVELAIVEMAVCMYFLAQQRKIFQI